jgi:hypothetical protein
VIDQLLQALESAQITGWQLLAALVVLIAAYPIGKLVQKLVVRTFWRVPNVPEVLVADVGRRARWLIYLLSLAISLSLLGLGVVSLPSTQHSRKNESDSPPAHNRQPLRAPSDGAPRIRCLSPFGASCLRQGN